jgi:hypothetical protein
MNLLLYSSLQSAEVGLKSDARRPAATVIYYASIASALVHHGHRITRLSYETLQNGYKELMEKPWVPAELKSLFEKASGVCRKRMTKPQ